MKTNAIIREELVDVYTDLRCGLYSIVFCPKEIGVPVDKWKDKDKSVSAMFSVGMFFSVSESDIPDLMDGEYGDYLANEFNRLNKRIAAFNINRRKEIAELIEKVFVDIIGGVDGDTLTVDIVRAANVDIFDIANATLKRMDFEDDFEALCASLTIGYIVGNIINSKDEEGGSNGKVYLN